MRRTHVIDDRPMPPRLRKKYRVVLNEPTIERSGDKVPSLAPVAIRRLGTFVSARLLLERELRLCGLAKPGRSITATPAVRQVLRAMLLEADSPLSASLRM